MLKVQEVVITSEHSGETHFSPSKSNFKTRPVIVYTGISDPQRTNRMLQYISNLMENAALQHISNLKENEKLHDNSELITRISLDEFSFYTQDSPLTIDEYKYLINEVHKLARRLPPNVHLQLATFPVCWPNQVMQNCSLYVQAPKKIGDQPLVHHMSKVISSGIDFQYARNGSLIPLSGDQYYLDKLYELGQSCNPNLVLAGTYVALNDVNQYKNALRFTSANGQMALQAFDICLDHAYGKGKDHLEGLIVQLGSRKEHVPVLASHIISSKTIEEVEANAAATITHADRLLAKVGKHKPVVFKEMLPINIKVGGFGANAKYSTYPAKTIGFLSGALFDRAITYNFQGSAVDVNVLYNGRTTILHDIVNGITPETNLERTLQRIRTLKKYKLSIDIENGQGFSVRTIICQHIVDAINVKDADLVGINTKIAKELGIIMKEILQFRNTQGTTVKEMVTRNIIKAFNTKSNLDIDKKIADQLGITTNEILIDFMKNPSSPVPPPPPSKPSSLEVDGRILMGFVDKTAVKYACVNKTTIQEALNEIEKNLFDFYYGRINIELLLQCNGLRQQFIDGIYTKPMIFEAFKDRKEFMEIPKETIETKIPISSSSEFEHENSRISEFNKNKEKIQYEFNRTLDALKTTLDSLNENDELKDLGDKLFDKLTKEQETFFKNLKPTSKKDEIEREINNFRKICADEVKIADKIMGHGWLYRTVEILIKAIGGLFAGIGMILGSVLGQGLVKPKHREKFANTFFTLHQTEQSKALAEFSSVTLGDGELEQGLLASKNFDN
jgi:hypothetical protein